MFPLNPGPRWQSSSARPVALALQQALGQELARVRQGSPEVPGISVRLLQAVATLLNSPHGGALAMAMHRSHFLTCPLMRQLSQYQVGALTLPVGLGSGLPRGGRELFPMELGGRGLPAFHFGDWGLLLPVCAVTCVPVCCCDLPPRSREGRVQILVALLAHGGALGGL